MLVFNYKLLVEDIHLLLLVVYRHLLQHFAFQLVQLRLHVLLLQLLLLVKQFILELDITLMLIAINSRLVAQLMLVLQLVLPKPVPFSLEPLIIQIAILGSVHVQIMLVLHVLQCYQNAVIKLRQVAFVLLRVNVLLLAQLVLKRLVTRQQSVLLLTLILNVQPIFQHALLQELEDAKLELHAHLINHHYNARLVHQEENVSGIQLH
jgi:hypothetical protein